ncbi:3-oxoacyl-ACP reductase FabG [Desulfosporosinus sp.]|uniref:3-oxoacyl-ACP reductase FabG n=1 Tax=Desulfosporosinus sp. TaxID=157907 RepID=UPI0025C2CB79|nr:3-oxoacyl-ACP reductase FabG [Desulfosporosinus sp.]MBC2724375.1 3-oxoacyl-ACP reductase FabG [Desulfosporosinus sp.]MBC2727743.1 3-oxoacyl-ACP reductase FabG [Desulfosporosinus sp.]
MAKLLNRVAVVTGAAQGIGAAIVKRLLEDGAASVVALDINQELLEQAAEELDPMGERVIPIKCNIADRVEVTDVFRKIYERLSKVDILVNNAGITRDAMFHKMTPEQWDSVISINLTSVYNCCQAVVNEMRKQKYGKIVNLSSTSAWGNIGQVNYSASKAGMIGMTKSLAKELGNKNITVNAIAPGLIDTEMTRSMPEHLKTMALMLCPAARVGNPSEIASVVSFLASDDSSFVNGECIKVCGGFLM